MPNLNSNVNIKRHENLWIIDPNGDGSNAVNLEDLNISVELEVLERGDEPIIYSDSNVTTTKSVANQATRISFIDGTGKEEKYLTTHYTELNTNFNKDNKDLGTLGIETIDISFNTSYVPIVKIRFKDIRGRLFELGDDSPYAFLFKMPYPIFYLTVKGYFGKPVQYALHMTKFNGNLDNETGSFIITCDFIGYTYAFLADLLMGVLKGIPFTEEGKKLIPNINGFTSFEELFVIVKKLEGFITKFRNEDPRLKALTIYDNLNTILNEIEETIVRDMDNIFNEDFKSLKETNINTSQYLYYSLNNSLKYADKLKKEYESSTLELVKKFNAVNDTSGDTKKYNLNIDDFKLDGDGIFIDGFNSFNFFKSNDIQAQSLNNGDIYPVRTPLTFLEFQESEFINNYNIFKTTGDKNIDIFKQKMYDNTVEIIKLKSRLNNNELKDSYAGLGWYVLDIRLVLEKLNILKETIKNDFDENKKAVTTDFTKAINTFLISLGTNFDASIGSLFKILCQHVDLFISVIKKIEENIENDRKNGNRKISEADKNNFTQYVDEGGATQISVGAFPEYIENEFNDGENALVETWLGSNDKFYDYQEVIFINDLYNSMMKAAKKDRELVSGIFNQTKGWFPVNPLETLAFNSENKNPWEGVADSNIQPVMKLVLQRMSIYLSYTNKNLTIPEVTNVAKIEANQLYNALINIKTKKGVIPDNSSNDQITKQLILYYGDSIDDFGKIGETNGLRLFKNGSDLIYHHDASIKLIGTPTSDKLLLETPEFIPLYQDDATLKSEKNTLNTAEGRNLFIGTFISNIISSVPTNTGILSQENVGSFIKIINKGEYKRDLNYDTYIDGGGDGIVNKLSEDSLISENSNLVGGVYRTHEFTQYKTGEQLTPLYRQFYNESIRSKLINRDLNPVSGFTFEKAQKMAHFLIKNLIYLGLDYIIIKIMNMQKHFYFYIRYHLTDLLI